MFGRDLFGIPKRENQISEIYVSGGGGTATGTTNTRIRVFLNLNWARGNAVIYNRDAALGDFFTIREDGLYHIVYNDAYSAAAGVGFGISVNVDATAILQNVDDIPAKNRLAYTMAAGANTTDAAVALTYLRAGDVVRAHSNTQVNLTDDARVAFRITKVS